MTALLAWMAAMPVQAHESDQKLEVPGYRPPTEQTAAYIQNVESSKIAVFPSIVRAVNPKENKVDQEQSTVALEHIVKFLGENELGSAEIVDIRFEVGEAPQKGQFALFNHTIETIAPCDKYSRIGHRDPDDRRPPGSCMALASCNRDHQAAPRPT